MDKKKKEQNANILITLKNIIKSQENKWIRKEQRTSKKKKSPENNSQNGDMYIPISSFTLNVSRLYALIKGYRMAE